MQQGTIFERSGAWYLQFWRTDFIEGQDVRRRVTEFLVRKDEQHRTERDVRILSAQKIADILNPINLRTHQPMSSMEFGEFVETRFFPYLKDKILREKRKPSLLKFYKDNFENHLKDSIGNIRLRDMTTQHVQQLLDDIDRKKSLHHKTLQRIKTTISAVFTYATQQNLVQRNPVQGTQVEGNRKKPDRYAYSLNEMLAMISVLPRRSATVVALAGLTGLREGEIRGLQWQDYDGETLSVARSVWRTHVHQPKTDASIDKVPVIPSLKTILNEYRTSVPNNPTDWIFDGNRKHTPLNLANLVRREMLPKLKPGTWHGWHGFRRGLATRLFEAKAQVEIIQEILRHSDPKVTQDSYIVVKSDKTTKAMQKVDSRAVLNAWKKSEQSRASKTKGHMRRRSAVFVNNWTKDGRNQLSASAKSSVLMQSGPR